MGRIQILPPDLVNQIAAGEVVERPASIIKELVENALDAGATKLVIEVAEGGRRLRISDNGIGMDADDLSCAFRNHATSKIHHADDLFALSTLGFRGEALASIAAIAKVTCMSRTQEAETGLKATVSHDGSVTLSPTGCAPGTIFEIGDLFYNVPARLKFLKRPQTELAHCQEMVQTLAISHPERAFQLTLEGNLAVETTGSGHLHTVLQEVYGLAKTEPLLPVRRDDPEMGLSLQGLTSAPSVYRGSKKWLNLFVNGRMLKCPILTKAIDSAYDGAITPGKFPVTAVFLTMPPDAVDVNVHPTKREVKYHQPNAIFSFVRGAIEQALLSHGATFRPQYEASPWQAPTQTTPKSYGSGGQAQRSYAMPFQSPQAQRDAALSLYAPSASHAAFEPLQAHQPSRLSVETQDWRVLGQLAKTFILLETPEGLLIVDQHIASERVQYERLLDQAERIAPAEQPQLVPLSLPISPALADCLQETAPSMAALGFDYTVSAGQVHFSKVPAAYTPQAIRTALEEMLTRIEQTGEQRLLFTDVLATMACHRAVRAGDVLNLAQMDAIITDWMACQRPWTCPHGRPVTHTLTHRELMAYFDRPSLPAGIVV